MLQSLWQHDKGPLARRMTVHKIHDDETQTGFGGHKNVSTRLDDIFFTGCVSVWTVCLLEIIGDGN